MNDKELFGSETAKGGFRNEEDVISKFNNWEKDEVFGKLDVKMTSAYLDVSKLARDKNLYMRDAAYVISINRVAQASRDRGWI